MRSTAHGWPLRRRVRTSKVILSTTMEMNTALSYPLAPPPRYRGMQFARDPNRYIQTGETQTILGTVCYVWRMVAKDLERLNSSRREKCLTDTGIPLVEIIDLSVRRAVVLKRERQDPAFFEIPPDAQ